MESFANKAVPMANDKYLKSFWKKKILKAEFGHWSKSP